MGGTLRQKYHRWRIRRACGGNGTPAPYIHAGHRNLLDRLETLKTILDGNVSVARFGDGELILCLSGRDIPFQNHRPELSEKLERILKEPDPGVLVCMNNAFMQSGSIPWILEYERSKKEYAALESLRRANDVGILSREK